MHAVPRIASQRADCSVSHALSRALSQTFVRREMKRAPTQDASLDAASSLRRRRAVASRVASKMRRAHKLSMSRDATKAPNPRPTKGLYANYFEIGHSAFEVVIDFGQTYEGSAAAPCHTRIVMTPVYAQVLLETLGEAVMAYNSRFGKAE
jgi:uncharacterized protein DUF3467